MLKVGPNTSWVEIGNDDYDAENPIKIMVRFDPPLR